MKCPCSHTVEHQTQLGLQAEMQPTDVSTVGTAGPSTNRLYVPLTKAWLCGTLTLTARTVPCAFFGTPWEGCLTLPEL